MLKTKTVLVFVFVVVALTATAQVQTKTPAMTASTSAVQNPNISDDGEEVVDPFNGTYRFVFTKGVKQIFTDEIFKTIELNRKEDEETILTLSSYCKVQILSRKQINAVDFIPFKRSYVFEN